VRGWPFEMRSVAPFWTTVTCPSASASAGQSSFASVDLGSMPCVASASHQTKKKVSMAVGGVHRAERASHAPSSRIDT
jgi:hypothetical protein